MPSGGPSSPSAKTRRSNKTPSAPMLKAVNRRPIDSATIRVRWSGVMAMPLGKSRSRATTLAVSSGSTRTMTPPLKACDPMYARPFLSTSMSPRSGRGRSPGATINSDPPGRTPRPDGEPPGSGSVVIDPLRVTVCTASPSMSENHSRPSNQRGPSPKQNPVASGVSPSTIAVIKDIQFSRDRPVVRVDLGGVDLLEQGVRQRGVFVRLDGHRPSEQRDVFARPAELILDRDASLQAAVAVAVMAKGPNGTDNQ